MSEQRMINNLLESCEHNDFYGGWTTFKAMYKSRFLTPTAIKKGKERAYMAINVLQQAFAEVAVPFFAEDMAKDILCTIFDVIAQYKLSVSDIIEDNLLERLWENLRQTITFERCYERAVNDTDIDEQQDVLFTIALSPRIRQPTISMSTDRLRSWINLCEEFVHRYGSLLSNEHVECISLTSEQFAEYIKETLNFILPIEYQFILLRTLLSINMLKGVACIAKIENVAEESDENVKYVNNNSDTLNSDKEQMSILMNELLRIAPLGPSSLQQTEDVHIIMNKYITHCGDWIQIVATFFNTVTHYIKHNRVCKEEEIGVNHFAYELTRSDAVELLKIISKLDVSRFCDLEHENKIEVNVILALLAILDNTPSAPREDHVTESFWLLINALFSKYNKVFAKYKLFDKSQTLLKY